jgi:cyclopropane-fatty-acyl-phospholipid synthase
MVMDAHRLAGSALSADSDRREHATSPRLEQQALGLIQRGIRSAPLRLVLWDGFALEPQAPPVGTLVFRTRRALIGCLWDPQLYFGEAYTSGELTVQGDLVAVLEAVYRAVGPRTRPSWLPQRANGLRASRSNVHHHYDIGNEFYRLWLDRELLYTCAYFPTPDVSLEDAQIAKMDLVCRTLRLSPGEHVIEAGCGWGSLALFMARRYGVTVRAFNISAEQIAYARDRARAEGLDGRVEFIEDDYRSVTGTCDVFVSVGMLEHVGVRHYRTLGEVIDRTLSATGRGLLHFIGRDQPGPLNPWIRRRIFPGGYAPTLREVFAGVLEPQALSVLDVENLRLHYAKTLEHWRRRFVAAADEVRSMFDDRFARAWELYLSGSQVAFSVGSMQLFQVVFARGRSNAVPWIRVASTSSSSTRRSSRATRCAPAGSPRRSLPTFGSTPVSTGARGRSSRSTAFAWG